MQQKVNSGEAEVKWPNTEMCKDKNGGAAAVLWITCCCFCPESVRLSIRRVSVWLVFVPQLLEVMSWTEIDPETQHSIKCLNERHRAPLTNSWHHVESFFFSVLFFWLCVSWFGFGILDLMKGHFCPLCEQFVFASFHFNTYQLPIFLTNQNKCTSTEGPQRTQVYSTSCGSTQHTCASAPLKYVYSQSSGSWLSSSMEAGPAWSSWRH